MEDLDFTLLEKSQLFGNAKLDMFKKYGTKATITDFAILLGGHPSSNYTNEVNALKDRTSCYYLKTRGKDNCCCVINFIGGLFSRAYVHERDTSIRVVSKYSSILDFSSSKVVEKQENIIEFGEYPQTIVNEVVSNELEKLYSDGKLQITGKNYTTDSVAYNSFDKPFRARKHIEYECNGQKYVRILGDYNSKGEKLSDGRIVEGGKPYWVKVEPIVWLIDKDRDIAVTEKLLFAGVQFNNGTNYTEDFNFTFLNYYLKNYFAKDIVPSKIESVNKDEKIVKYYNYEVKNRGAIRWSDEPYWKFLSGLYVEFMAYEKDGILRDVLTDLPVVPENANYISDDAIVYSSIKETYIENLYKFLLLHIQSLQQQNELYVTILKREYIKYISGLLKKEELKKYSDDILKDKADEYILSMNKNNKMEGNNEIL